METLPRNHHRSAAGCSPFTGTIVLFFCLAFTLAGAPATAQQADLKIPDYSKNPEWFPKFYRPYNALQVSNPDLRNSRALAGWVRDGKIRLSLEQLKTAVRENNLEVLAASYNVSLADTDVLRAKGGGAPRGGPGIQIPSGLFAGALGEGVGEAAGVGGSRGAGGISGGGRQVTIRPRGSFDPSFVLNLSKDRTASPLNTLRVSGVANVITATTALQARYAQAFTTGTTISITFSNQRQSSTQQFLRFNPSFVSAFSFSFTQQILNGSSRAVNRRFLDVARNGQQIAREYYRQQVVAALARAQAAYWDLVAARENVRLAEKSLAVAEQLLEDNKVRLEIGRVSRMEVVTAESEAASRKRDLVVARMNLQLKEVDLKSMLSKEIDPALEAAEIEPVDALPAPDQIPIPQVGEALAQAMARRPEILQAEGNILNQAVSVKYADNLLKPNLTLFGLLSSSGLYGDRVIQDPAGGPPIRLPGGMEQAFRQVRSFSFPEYAVGFSFSLPLFNRSARADSQRARLEQRRAETSLEQTRNRISLEVRRAVIGLVQAKARIEAARKAVALSADVLAAEEERLRSGVSTPYNVIRRQRDLLSAQFAEVQARATYAKTGMEMSRSMGLLYSGTDDDK